MVGCKGVSGIYCQECTRPLSPRVRLARSGNANWWCRDCAFSLCCDCHLLKGHDDHRTAEWSPEELAGSCVRYFQERSARRAQRFEEDGASISRFVRTLEELLQNAYRRRHEEVQTRDDLKVKSIQRYFNLPNEILTPVRERLGFSRDHLKIPVDSRLERALNQLCGLPSCTDLVGHLHEAEELSGGHPEMQNDGLLFFNPEMIVNIIREKLFLNIEDFASPKAKDDRYNNKPEFRFDCCVGDKDRLSQTTVPIEPEVRIVSPPLRSSSASPGAVAQPMSRDAKTSQSFRSVKRVDATKEPPPVNAVTVTQSVRLVASCAIQTDSLPATQDGHIQCELVQTTRDNRGGVCKSPIEGSQPTQTREKMCQTEQVRTCLTPDSISLGWRTNSPSPHNLSLDSSRLTSEENSAVTVVDGSAGGNCYDLGADFFTRPLDVCFIGNIADGLVAVSDACAGVYLLTREGSLVSHIWTDGGSASSIAYVDDTRLLYVSVLRGDGVRVVNVYDLCVRSETYSPLESIPCPVQPVIEVERTRWLAATKSGDLFLVAGDNHLSAIWMFSRYVRRWTFIHSAKRTRYQYAAVVEDHPAKGYVTIMTGDGLKGRVLMFFLNDSLKIVREVDVSRHWGLVDAVMSPASMMWDQNGNVLILDYFSAVLWIVRLQPSSGRSSSKSNGAVGSPTVEKLLTLEAKEAIGLASAADGWCYLACLATKRVRAVRYAV